MTAKSFDRLSAWRGVIVAGAALVALAACASAMPPADGEAEASGWPGVALNADPAQIAAGRQIAERECAQCHAVERTGKSPNPEAPPLRNVLAVNDAESLAYRFIEAMRVGHDAMPLFDFDVRAADALIAYIATISE
jgi:cytochrome c